MPQQNQNQAVGQPKTCSKKEKKRLPEGHVKKTENSFMLFKKFFDQQYKAYCLAKGSKAVASNKICQVAGGYWQTMSVISRRPFLAHAQHLTEQHRLAHPELAGSSRARGAVGGGADITVSAPARKRRRREKEDAVVDLAPFVEFLDTFPAKLATYEAILTTNLTPATSASTSSTSTPIAVTPTPTPTPTTTLLSGPSQGNFIFYCAPPTAGPSSSSAPSAPHTHTEDTYTHCPPFLPTDRANIKLSGTSRRPSAERSLAQVKYEQREPSVPPNEARLPFYPPTFKPFPNSSLAPDILADFQQHVPAQHVRQEHAPYWPMAPEFRPVYDDWKSVDLLGEQANGPNWQQFVPMPPYPPAARLQPDYVQHTHWKDPPQQQSYLQGTHEQGTHAHEASTSRIPEHNGFAMLACDGHLDFSADLPLRYPTSDSFARSFSPESPDVPWHPKSW